MMPLTLAKSGETVAIKKIGGQTEVRQHLAELGFVVDEKVTIVNEVDGNLIIKVKDGRVALGKALAAKIMF